MITNAGELYAEIEDYINREDLTAKMPHFVRLAEADIYRDLQCQDNEFMARYQQTQWKINGQPGAVPVPGQHEMLPPNFSVMRQISWNGKPLQSVSDTEMRSRLSNHYDSTTNAFCLVNRTIVFSAAIENDPALWPSTSVLDLSYWGTESLSSMPTWHVPTNPVESPVVEDITPQALEQTAANTTRMLQRNPDIYLYGGCYHASVFVRHQEGIALWGGLFQKALGELKLEGIRHRYAGSTKQVRSAY